MRFALSALGIQYFAEVLFIFFSKFRPFEDIYRLSELFFLHYVRRSLTCKIIFVCGIYPVNLEVSAAADRLRLSSFDLHGCLIYFAFS